MQEKETKGVSHLTCGSRKFTSLEKQDAKVIVRECIISRLSREESLAYLKQKTKRKDLNVFDFDKLKRSLKNDTEKWMNSLMKDRWAYVAQYKERVDEYNKYQKEYWRIFRENPHNGILQKTLLDSLQNTSAAITQLYDIMPEIAGGQFTNVKDPISKTTEEEIRETETTKPTPWTS